MGEWYNFLRRRKKGWSIGHYTCMEMVDAKMFYGEMALVSGRMASLLNSSTESKLCNSSTE